MDNDGWLDLHFSTRQPGAEGLLTDLVFQNRGAQLSDNHALSVRLDGRTEAELLGARVTASVAGNTVATGWYEREAWRGSRDPAVHLGLAEHDRVDIDVRTRAGHAFRFADIEADTPALLTLPATP
jgi:hypothetical protein